MPVTKIKSQWSSGNLSFYDLTGNDIIFQLTDNYPIAIRRGILTCTASSASVATGLNSINAFSLNNYDGSNKTGATLKLYAQYGAILIGKTSGGTLTVGRYNYKGNAAATAGASVSWVAIGTVS